MRKRLLSWLLVLTMVTSLIPSTLVTTAFAADNPSAQASSQAGKTKVETTLWPSDLNADITDFRVTGTIIPGDTLTVKSGKTLIVHGSGTLSGSGRAQQTPFFIVEDGGHLVLDNVVVTLNQSDSGTVVVEKGGLLDLGYNDQKDRFAPSITGNTMASQTSAARNLVVADGATVRLNAAATKKIGVSQVEVKDYSTPKNTQSASYIPGMKPLSVIQGGRYTIADSDLTYVTADVSEKYEKIVLAHDNLILRSPKPKVLNWSPDDFMGVGGGYDSTPNYTHGWWIRAYLAMTADAPDNTGGDSSKTPNMMQIYGYRDYRWHTSDTVYTRVGLSKAGDLSQYDVIYINFPFSCIESESYYDEEVKLLQDYLNSGGRVVIQGENTEGNYGVANTRASVLANHLGAGFDLLNEATGQEYVTTNADTNLGKGISSVTGQGLKTGNASTIRSNGKADYTTIAYVTLNGEQRDVIVDQQAGTTAEKWGSLTVIADADLVRRGNSANAAVEQFYRNLLADSVERRNMAAAGFNPNKKIDKQATTTTTTVTTDYQTPYAALQKAVETNTVTLLTNSNAELTPTRDELLFEHSTLAYEAGSTYGGSTIHADTAGVYLDITKTGEVNLRSGTVTVTPKDKNYVLTMNGTMDQDGTAITGGYKITSNTAYTLDADDEKTPILPENGGGASITIPNKGESVTVDYGNGKSVTYTAKENNEKVYLGWYQVNKNTPSNVTWTDADKAWYGQTYTTILTPNAGYEVNGENLTVADTDNITLNGYELTKQGDPVKDPDDETVTWTTYASTEKDRDGNPKVTVKQQHLHSGGADRNGIAIVTVNDVRADITIGAANGTVNAKAPTIYVVGIGQRTGYQDVQLWEYTTVRNTKDGVLAKPVNGWPWEKWIVTSAASGDGTESDYKKDKVTLTSDASKLDTTNETATYTINLETGDKVVVFYYSWHMVKVTINAEDANGVAIPDFTPQVVEYEIGEQVTITAPNLPGYTAQTPSQDYTPNETDHEITFKYNKSTGNLYYKAVYVDADGIQRDLGTFDGGVLVRGQAPNKSAQYAPKFGNYVLKTQEDGVASADKYDGINDITVTYTYTARTKDIKVYAYVGDTNGQILQLDTTSYAGLTTGQTITINAPEIAGYKVKGNTSSSHNFFISNDDVAQDVQFFYEKDTSNEAYVLVKLVDSANGNKEIGSYQVPGVKDKAQLISVPAAPYGYKLDNAHAADNVEQTVTPTGADAPYTAEVTFYFVPNVHTVTIKLTDSDTSQPLNVITNYKYKYEVVDGEDLTVIAPSIYGYTMTADSESVVKLTGVTKDEVVEFKYQAIDKQLVTIHVKGMIEGEADARFNFTETVLFRTQSKDVAIFNIPGYKLKEATIDGVKVDPTPAGNTLNVVTANAPKGGTINVVLTYESNMANVTVQAKYNKTVMQSYTIKVEKGTQTLISAPAIPGYTATETSKNVPVDADTTVDFEYTKDSGNVTVVAVEKGGKELFRQDAGTVTRGDKLDLTGDAKAPGIQYYTASADPTSVVVNGQPVADIANYTYTGIGDVVVTYEYTRNLRDLVIIKKDAATNQEIPGSSETLTGLKAGESHTFLPGEGTAPSGYEVAPNRNPSSFFVEDKADQQVVFWYKNTSADQYTQITVNLECGGKVFQTYPVTAVKGVETTVMAPTVKGYTINGVSSRQITPDGTTAHDTLTFSYTITNEKNVKVVLKDNTDDSELNASSSYIKDYTLKDGDSLDIWAPAIDGYTLMSATVGTNRAPNKQFVTVRYEHLTVGDNTVTFRYFPVAQANFVTHTIEFKVGDHLLYSHEKMIAKGTGTQVIYKADDVKYMVPGYAYDSITYTVAGKNTATAADVKDNVNATITYHFVEDTATITIKKVDGSNTPLSGVADTVLTGYRKGQTVQVVAPVVDGFALDDTLIKDVSLDAANKEVTFQYVTAGEVTFTLKELKADGTESIIAVLNADTTKIYNAKLTDGTSELDLSKYGYTYTPSDKTAEPFNVGGTGIVTDLTTAAKYVVYYTKDLRNVQYFPVDKTKLDKAGKTLDDIIGTADDVTYVIGELNPAEMEKARVGETYKAVAQSFTGWALKDDFSKLYKVEAGTGALKVYFLYEQKTTGIVTVHYHFGEKPTDPNGNYGKLLNEYSIEAVVGEKVKVTPQAYLMDSKYHLRDGQASVTLTVTENTETIDFFYEANYVTVTVNTVVNSGNADKHDEYEVVKGKNLTIYPPVKAGYTLVGITASGYTLTGGAADALPDGYTNNALPLTNLTADATVTCYYKTTSATEYQTVLTVEYVYNGYKLIADKTINVNTGETTAIDVPAFDGYKATLSTFVDEGAAPAGSGITGVTVNVAPNGKTATLTITYERPDGSVVLPGADDIFTAPNDKDNVVVKPDDGNTTLTPNPAPVDPATEPVKGSVTVPDDTTATVTRPKDPQNPENGSEDITVPGGTTINPNGTIVLPKNPDGTGGGEIGPNDKIPDNLPEGFVAITYDANNGTGEVKKEIGKKGELQVKGELFTHPTNAKFEGWNDSGLGNGTPYAEGKKVDASIKLYAKWSANCTYRATITYKPNGGTPDKDVFQNVGHDTDPKLTVTLPNSHFQVSGWTFGGWNTAADGSGDLYQADTTLALSHGDAKELFAQWYKVNADGSIEVPGKDGNPKDASDNATAKGDGKGKDPTRDNATGEITIPKGGSVILPDGSVIGMPDGGKLLPNGTVIINRPDTDGDGKSEGTITIPGADGTNPDVTDKDGNPEANKTVYTLTYTYTINNGENVDDVLVKVVEGDEIALIDCPFDWAGYTFINWIKQSDKTEHLAGDKLTVTADETYHAQWMKVNADGSVELPGKDGSIVDADDNVIVTPDQGGKITPQPDGSVKVEDEGGTVNRPKDPANPDAGREDIKVPEGTIVKPDGTIILPEPQPNGTTINPDDKLPGNTPTGYVSVVYKANGGTGDDVIVVIKEGETITAIANPFTNGNQTFSGWNTAENGIGGTAYDKNATITVEAGSNSVTLYAQWGKSESYNHTAKITYKANDGVTSDIEDTVGANDSTTFSTTLRQNPFSVNGWTFGGWNTEADGSSTLKAAGDVIEVNEGVDQTWYAQWYKVNDDGSITVPGDGNPNTTGDNVTANGDGKSGNVTRDNTTGNVTIPAGGNVVKGNETIALPDGAVLKPDGSLTINKPNGGTIDIDKDGNTTDANVIVLTYEANDGSTKSVKVYATKNEAIKALAADTFVYSGHTFLYWQSGNDTHKAGADITPTGDMSLIAAWAKVNPDGSIELPGKDGKLDGPNGEEKDNVIVTPDNKDGLEGPKADDGSVEVKPDHDATVTRPDPTDPNYPNGNAKEDIKVPEGTIIYPDGTIELPDGTKVTPDQPFPDVAGTYVTVTFDAGRGSGNTVKLIVAKNIDINLLDESVFVAPANHYFVGWVSGNDTYDANARYTVTGAVTFTAEYKERAELTKAVAIFDYAGGVDTAGNGSKYVTGKAGATITGIDDPNRTGYRFDGWDKTLEFGAVGSVTVFTAQWTINKYDVTFEPGTDGSLDSGDANAVYQVEHDTSVTTIPTVSANAGKVFVGWLNSLDNSVYTADRLANYKVTGDVTFTAQYVDEDKATVIFVFAGGTVNGQHSEVRTGTPGEPIGTLPEPQREGYTFNDWDAAVAATTTFKGAGSVIVYTAQWTPIQKQTFTVTFDIDATKGSTSDATAEQVEDGGFVTTVPAVTANAAYKFVAWQDQDGKLYFEAGIKLYPITKNTTFTAVFEEITVNPGTATVIFDGNGGKIGNNTVLTRVGVPGEKVDAPANPTRPGYEFLGWDGFDANTVYGAADTVTTYVAQWKAIEYTIHFSAAGATGSTAEQLYKFDGSTANTLNLNGFKLSGKQFIGWSLTEGATSADYVDGALINDTLRANLAASNTNSVTLYAVWQDAQQNTLTVTGNKTSAKPGETVDFTAFLNGAATTDVTWIVSGGKTGTSISANGVLTVGSSETNGTTLTVTAIYKLDTGLTASATVRVVVDGGNTGGGGGGTVTTSYTINASAGKGGTISPDGTVKVSRGDNKTFTIAASNGYIIADVLVDGVSVGAVSSYTFTKVSKDHTISVVFKEARPGVADPSETGVDQWLRVTDHIAYMHGYDNGNFGPMDNLTRAQAAQLFYRLLVNQDVEITVSFNDVPADAWYAKAVNTLASLSIIKGIGNGKFDPDREISRAEFIVIATRFAKTIDKVNSPFVDVADDAWYAPYVATATSYGWITGVGEGRFAPDDLVTRAEAATIVNRMLARSADREFVDGNAVQHFSDVTPDAWYYYQIMEAANGHSHRYSEDGYEVWNGLN